VLAGIVALAAVATGPGGDEAPPGDELSRFRVPRTWDEEALLGLELPLADPRVKPVHVTAAYYYAIPVRRFYKSYPIYHPAREPRPEGKSYLEWLRAQKPEEVLHDFSSLRTEADWLAKGPALGKEVFEAPIADQSNPFLTLGGVNVVRDPAWYESAGILCDEDGRLPYLRYVVSPEGVGLGTFSCAMCHTRVEQLPDGKKIVIAGAQGNFPFDRAGN
jgi:hypothetical protein